MAKTLLVSQKSELKIDESISGVGTNVGNVTYAHNIASNGNLNASTDPDATNGWTGRVALVAAAATLDLTALTYDDDREDVDLTGLKVVALKVFCPLTNTGPIRIEGGATNPYELFGDADTEIQVYPGSFAVFGVLDGGGANLAAVAAGVKEIDFAGTGTDVIDVTIVAGDDNP